MTDKQQLISHDEARRHAFDSVLHRQTNKLGGGVSALTGKDTKAYAAASKEYFQYWDDKKAEDETEEVRQERTDNYATITRQYYNLATDLYEYGWSQCFHFCRFAYGETFHRAIARHEHYIAHSMSLHPGMRVLDVGCGVGGPAREIAKFSGVAHITGLNLNEYQVSRANNYAKREGLANRLDFVQGDFMDMPFPDNSFDAVYAIEATCHAPSLKGVYSEIRRVLKPGGVFGVYEWLMTDAYDDDDLDHRRIRLAIEQGDGIPRMFSRKDGLQAMEDAGFDLEHHEDLAAGSVSLSDSATAGPHSVSTSADLDSAPWYWPLGSDFRYAQTLGDLLTVARMNRWGRVVAHNAFSVMEALWIAPKGTRKTAESLGAAADALVEGGRRGLFTPMYLMIGRKPVAEEE